MSENTPHTNEVAALFSEYIENRDTNTRNLITEKSLYLVDILVRKYLNKGIDYDDLYQVGSMALLLAVERFDPMKGYEFSSFATPTIIGEIKRYFRDKGWSMRVPRRLKEIAMQMQLARESLSNELQRAPTIPEIAVSIGCSEEEVLEAMEISQNYHAFSLNQSFSEGGEGEESGIENVTGMQEKGYADFENNDLINSIVKEFSDKERQIFKRRLLGDLTQQQMATELGVSQMTVSRIENEIRNKFRAEIYK